MKITVKIMLYAGTILAIVAFAVGLIAALYVNLAIIMYVVAVVLLVIIAHNVSEDTWILTQRFAKWSLAGSNCTAPFRATLFIAGVVPVLVVDFIWGLCRGVTLGAMLVSLVYSCRNDEEPEEGLERV